ncbi:MAG: lipoprotein insertase outer membrane protein LolB [Methylococcales bacterium]|nr:lipoprotein insertase outer membrane protein LolB [Methylococcales bacterium]
MRIATFKPFLWMTLFVLISGCTEMVVKPVEDKYHLSERKNFYDLKKWRFTGRLVIVDKKESWTATLEWHHLEKKETLTLSGPLGQSAIKITLTENLMTLDRGDGKVTQSEDITHFIEQQLGMVIPVKSLRYWVLGLTHPDKPFVQLADGFEQEKWIIQYREMQQINKKWMPRKLKAMRGKTRLKLVIDQWTL